MFLSSDPHDDLATPLERSEQIVANIQDGDSGDLTLEQPTCSVSRKKRRKRKQSRSLWACGAHRGLLTGSGHHLLSPVSWERVRRLSGVVSSSLASFVQTLCLPGCRRGDSGEADVGAGASFTPAATAELLVCAEGQVLLNPLLLGCWAPYLLSTQLCPKHGCGSVPTVVVVVGC